MTKDKLTVCCCYSKVNHSGSMFVFHLWLNSNDGNFNWCILIFSFRWWWQTWALTDLVSASCVETVRMSPCLSSRSAVLSDVSNWEMLPVLKVRSFPPCCVDKPPSPGVRWSSRLTVYLLLLFVLRWQRLLVRVTPTAAAPPWCVWMIIGVAGRHQLIGRVWRSVCHLCNSSHPHTSPLIHWAEMPRSSCKHKK